MKRKANFICDDLAREIIERNLRGFIRKCDEGENAADFAEIDVNEDQVDRSEDMNLER